MQLTVSGVLNQFQRILQGTLFSTLQEQLGPLSDKHRQLAAVLSMIEIEALVGSWSGGQAPARHRAGLCRQSGVQSECHAAVAGSSVGRCILAAHMRLGESAGDPS